jgi:hypothetical protein
MTTKAHPGFATVQSSISKRMGVPKAQAGAILASAARKSSKAAVRCNSRLARVSGVPKPVKKEKKS